MKKEKKTIYFKGLLLSSPFLNQIELFSQRVIRKQPYSVERFFH